MARQPTRPINRIRRKLKLVEEVRATSRVRGRLCDYKGITILLIDQKAHDIWKERNNSISEARLKGEAGLAVDETLLGRAREKGAVAVLAANEELGIIYAVLISDFFDKEVFKVRQSFMNRRLRVIDLGRCKIIK